MDFVVVAKIVIVVVVFGFLIWLTNRRGDLDEQSVDFTPAEDQTSVIPILQSAIGP